MIPKFRAYDTKWKRWILPDDISYYDGEWFFERRGEDGGDVIETAQLKDGIVLEQYTGLKDRHDKVLDWWEGDLLLSHAKYKIQIVYKDGCFWFQDIETPAVSAPIHSWLDYLHRYTKIGTIHDEEKS